MVPREGFAGRGFSSRVRVHITRQRPANNRTLEYTNRHSIRAVDRGSYRNLLCSGEVATAVGTGCALGPGGEGGRVEGNGEKEVAAENGRR